MAVKDVHEHLYLAVEKTDNTYRLTGVLHYSLVGEQALFKVLYCSFCLTFIKMIPEGMNFLFNLSIQYMFHLLFLSCV